MRLVRTTQPAVQVKPVQSEFEMSSSKIVANLIRSRQKLNKLGLLTRRSFTFGSQTSEIQHLISIIRQDMTNLNCQIMDLQRLNNAKIGSYPNKSAEQHAKAIILGLQAELANITSSFKATLELRNSTDQEKTERRSRIAGGIRDSTQAPQASHDSFLIKHDAIHRQRYRLDSPGTEEVAIAVGQQATELARQDVEDRTEAMRNVEETIVQLGEVFHQLATMVQEQGEMVQRIDANIEEVHYNLEFATVELNKYFRSISSSRWLMIKIFAILFLFLIVFIVFFL